MRASTAAWLGATARTRSPLATADKMAAASAVYVEKQSNKMLLELKASFKTNIIQFKKNLK